MFVGKIRMLDGLVSTHWKPNRREPKSCLGQAFNFKLGRFVLSATEWHSRANPHLELKTRPRLPPINFRAPRTIPKPVWVPLLYGKVQYH